MQELIDYTQSCFNFQSCVAASGEYSEYLNIEWATTDIHHWNVWTVGEMLCKVLFVIREYSMFKLL